MLWFLETGAKEALPLWQSVHDGKRYHAMGKYCEKRSLGIWECVRKWDFQALGKTIACKGKASFSFHGSVGKIISAGVRIFYPCITSCYTCQDSLSYTTIKGAKALSSFCIRDCKVFCSGPWQRRCRPLHSLLKFGTCDPMLLLKLNSTLRR